MPALLLALALAWITGFSTNLTGYWAVQATFTTPPSCGLDVRLFHLWADSASASAIASWIFLLCCYSALLTLLCLLLAANLLDGREQPQLETRSLRTAWIVAGGLTICMSAVRLHILTTVLPQQTPQRFFGAVAGGVMMSYWLFVPWMVIFLLQQSARMKKTAVLLLAVYAGSLLLAAIVGSAADVFSLRRLYAAIALCHLASLALAITAGLVASYRQGSTLHQGFRASALSLLLLLGFGLLQHGAYQRCLHAGSSPTKSSQQSQTARMGGVVKEPPIRVIRHVRATMDSIVIASGAFWYQGASPFLTISYAGWLRRSGLVDGGCLACALALSAWVLTRRRARDTLAYARLNMTWFTHTLSGLRELNPILWLWMRSPQLRAAQWGWCLLVLVGEWVVIASDPDHDPVLAGEWQLLFLTPLLMGFSWSAASSFAEEKRSGALELLLVLPVAPIDIINSRWHSLLWEFAPACFLLGINAFFQLHGQSSGLANLLLPFAYCLPALLLFIPIAGMNLSLRQPNGMRAWLSLLLGLSALLLVTMGLPWFLNRLTGVVNPALKPPSAGLFSLLSVGVAYGLYGDLERVLVRRPWCAASSSVEPNP